MGVLHSALSAIKKLLEYSVVLWLDPISTNSQKLSLRSYANGLWSSTCSPELKSLTFLEERCIVAELPGACLNSSWVLLGSMLPVVTSVFSPVLCPHDKKKKMVKKGGYLASSRWTSKSLAAAQVAHGVQAY
jgi:hypothetical protein